MPDRGTRELRLLLFAHQDGLVWFQHSVNISATFKNKQILSCEHKHLMTINQKYQK
jgi:hypothetical protein